MNKKSFIATIIFVLSVSAAFAQDRIFQSNGNVIEAKIKEINKENIIYTHWSNVNGSVYSISLREVDKVRYENGVEERFNGENDGENMTSTTHAQHIGGNQYRSADMKLADNILAIAPIQFTENGVGVALSYEKTIDKAGIIAYSLPVIATFNLNGQTEAHDGKHQDAMFYFSPGLKFYPTGSRGRTKYAIGPSLVIGAGEKTTGGAYHYWSGYSYLSGFNPYETHSKFMLGILVNNSLNINPSPRMYIGMDFGFGFTYINQLGGANQGITGMVQAGFKIGYRF